MTIQQQDLTNAILALADAEPDFVYPHEWNEPIYAWDGDGDETSEIEGYSDDCEYRHPERPETEGACIIGQAIFRIGEQGYLPERGDVQGVSSLLEGQIDSAERDEFNYLCTLNLVQAAQDRGERWGQAVMPLRAYEAARGR